MAIAFNKNEYCIDFLILCDFRLLLLLYIFFFHFQNRIDHPKMNTDVYFPLIEKGEKEDELLADNGETGLVVMSGICLCSVIAIVITSIDDCCGGIVCVIASSVFNLRRAPIHKLWRLVAISPSAMVAAHSENSSNNFAKSADASMPQ